MREGSKEWEKGMIGNSDGEEEVAKRGIWSPVFRREQGQGYCRKGSWIYQWGHFGLRNKVDQNLGAKDWGLNWWPQGSGSSYELTLSKVYSSRIWEDSLLQVFSCQYPGQVAHSLLQLQLLGIHPVLYSGPCGHLRILSCTPPTQATYKQLKKN